jgi:hypothetical protein
MAVAVDTVGHIPGRACFYPLRLHHVRWYFFPMAPHPGHIGLAVVADLDPVESEKLMKYETFTELYGAYMAGAVKTPLVIDNDSVTVNDPETGRELFEMHPEELLLQTLALLAIPTEPV